MLSLYLHQDIQSLQEQDNSVDGKGLWCPQELGKLLEQEKSAGRTEYTLILIQPCCSYRNAKGFRGTLKAESREKPMSMEQLLVQTDMPLRQA